MHGFWILDQLLSPHYYMDSVYVPNRYEVLGSPVDPVCPCFSFSVPWPEVHLMGKRKAWQVRLDSCDTGDGQAGGFKITYMGLWFAPASVTRHPA